MTTITLRFDDVERSFLERHPLPYLDNVGVQSTMHRAIHRAMQTRQIVGVIGPKGLGKSVRADDAIVWFQEIEARRAKKDDRYEPYIAVSLGNLRQDDYGQVLAWILQQIDAREPVSNRGRRRKPVELRERIATLCLQRRVGLILADECEALSEHALTALRDVHAGVADHARAQYGSALQGRLAGIGMVLIGSPEFELTLQRSTEFGHRVASVFKLRPVSVRDATTALTAWLPAAAALTGDELHAWNTFVRATLCRDGDTTVRFLENLVRAYVGTLEAAGRLKHAQSWADVPIDFPVMTAVSAELPPPDLTVARPRKRRG